jgi:hypothetical protein
MLPRDSCRCKSEQIRNSGYFQKTSDLVGQSTVERDGESLVRILIADKKNISTDNRNGVQRFGTSVQTKRNSEKGSHSIISTHRCWKLSRGE